jgi:hypothetical protein
MSGDVSHIVVNEDEATLRGRLAHCSTVPEFTMQAVSSMTDVPGDTLRSWQRRYGFPTPARNDSNYRLFSRRDIEAVRWIRDQTARGQGTREAIAMLRRIQDGLHGSAPVSVTGARPSSPDAAAPDGLIRTLLSGDLRTAQATWDALAMTASPTGLCERIILPAHSRIWNEEVRPAIRIPADDFLYRKAMAILDRSSPELGLSDIIVLMEGSALSRVPALVLAATVSMNGYQLALPVLDLQSVESILVLQQTAPDTRVIVVAPDAPHAARHLLPGRSILHWWYHDLTGQGRSLPSSISEAVEALREPT